MGWKTLKDYPEGSPGSSIISSLSAGRNIFPDRRDLPQPDPIQYHFLVQPDGFQLVSQPPHSKGYDHYGDHLNPHCHRVSDPDLAWSSGNRSQARICMIRTAKHIETGEFSLLPRLLRFSPSCPALHSCGTRFTEWTHELISSKNGFVRLKNCRRGTAGRNHFYRDGSGENQGKRGFNLNCCM